MKVDPAASSDSLFDALLKSNTALTTRLDELIHLMRLGRLEDGHILRFIHNDLQVRLSLPYAERDYIQKMIVKGGTFYEIRQLDLLQASGLVPSSATIIDVGANIGNHSVYFAHSFRPAHLICVEPQASARQVLETNLALNGVSDALVLNCLVGSACGRGEAAGFIRGNLGGTSFRETPTGGVELRTLDSILQHEAMGKVDFVKIDVEGMHVEVLSGADHMLSTARPLIWIELRELKNEYVPAASILERYDYHVVHKLGAHDFLFGPVAR